MVVGVSGTQRYTDAARPKHVFSCIFIQSLLFSGFAAREGAIGIYAVDSTRKRGDISGESMPFQFTIEDNTRGQGDPRHSAVRDGKPYKVVRLSIFTLALSLCWLARLLLTWFIQVKILIGTSSLMHESSYEKPGTYLIEVHRLCVFQLEFLF